MASACRIGKDVKSRYLADSRNKRPAMSDWIEGIHYYINEQGLFVLTEKFHLERGYCCGNGCKHCPYHYERVPEPKKSELLRLRQDQQPGKE
jgi:hypothetical protein